MEDHECKFKPTERFWLYIFVIITMINSCNMLGNQNKILDFLLENKENIVSIDRDIQNADGSAGLEPRPPEVKKNQVPQLQLWDPTRFWLYGKLPE